MNNFESNRVNRDTFPSLLELHQVLYDINFDNLLNLIKNLIVNANRMNQNFVRVNTNDLNQYNQNIIDEMRNYLVNKGYTVIIIEDPTGVNMGWKINF
jgi:hypothetical protein